LNQEKNCLKQCHGKALYSALQIANSNKKKWLYWSVLFSAKIRPLYIPYGYFSAMKKKSEILAVSVHPL